MIKNISEIDHEISGTNESKNRNLTLTHVLNGDLTKGESEYTVELAILSYGTSKKDSSIEISKDYLKVLTESEIFPVFFGNDAQVKKITDQRNLRDGKYFFLVDAHTGLILVSKSEMNFVGFFNTQKVNAEIVASGYMKTEKGILTAVNDKSQFFRLRESVANMILTFSHYGIDLMVKKKSDSGLNLSSNFFRKFNTWIEELCGGVPKHEPEILVSNVPRNGNIANYGQPQPVRYVQPKPNVVLQHQPVRYVQQAPLKRFVQNQPQLVHQPQILHANPAIKYYGHSQPIVPGKLIQDPAVIVIDRNRALGKPSSDSEIKEYLAYLDRTYFHKKQGGYNYPDESVLKNPVNKGSAPVNLKESMAIKNKPLLKPALEHPMFAGGDLGKCNPGA